ARRWRPTGRAPRPRYSRTASATAGTGARASASRERRGPARRGRERPCAAASWPGLLDAQPAEDRLGMLAGDGGPVRRAPADGRDRAGPRLADLHRPHDREGVGAGIAGPDLASVLRARDQAGDQPDGLLDDVVMPDLGELREIARFADHHLG